MGYIRKVYGPPLPIPSSEYIQPGVDAVLKFECDILG